MTKIFYIITVSLIALGIMTSCTAENKVKQAQAHKEKEAVPVLTKEEFEGYSDEVIPIVSEFLELAEEYDTLRGSTVNEEITGDIFKEKLSDILTGYSNQQARVKEVDPPKLMRETHEKLIGMMSKNIEAMVELVSAVESGDLSKVASASSLQTESEKMFRDFSYDIEDIEEQFEW